MHSANGKSIKVGLLIIFLTSLIIIGLSTTSFMQKNEWLIYDALMRLQRSDTPLPEQIKVILVDDAALKALNPVVGRWPWPRSIFADVVDYITLGSPKAILFDILFSENQVDNKHSSDEDSITPDQRLVDATQQAGMVFHAMQFSNDDNDIYSNDLDRPLPKLIRKNYALKPNKLSANNNAGNWEKYNNYLLPIKGLYANAKGLGVVSFGKDSDGVHRRTQFFYQYQNESFPALSVAPLVQQQGVAQHNIPNVLSSNKSQMINMYGISNGLSMSGVLNSIAKLKKGEVENLIIDPKEFENKYVFIGTSAAGLQDLKTTSLQNNTPGVYLHAAALANVLTNDLLQPIDNNINQSLIVIAILITIVGVLLSRQLSVQILTPLFVTTALFATAYVAFQNHYVINVVSPVFAVFLAWATGFSYLLFAESKDKKILKRTFSRYVSPAAMSIIEKDYEEYRSIGVGTKETVTLLFSDIRGFTGLSEKESAETVVEILNHYFSDMTKIIHKHNGTIDKFIGDAIMAFWGVPIKSNTHAIDSLKAAIEMVEQLKPINAWLQDKNLEEISIGVGIHTGDVILGSIGSEQRADFTAIGNSVNLASRLEGTTKYYNSPIIISESTYNLVKNAIPCRLVDMVKVKGKDHAVKIYAPITNLPETESRLVENQVELAFTCYKQRHWDAAISYFQALPQHPTNQIMIERCQTYKMVPPPNYWDGTYMMRTK